MGMACISITTGVRFATVFASVLHISVFNLQFHFLIFVFVFFLGFRKVTNIVAHFKSNEWLWIWWKSLNFNLRVFSCIPHTRLPLDESTQRRHSSHSTPSTRAGQTRNHQSPLPSPIPVQLSKHLLCTTRWIANSALAKVSIFHTTEKGLAGKQYIQVLDVPLCTYIRGRFDIFWNWQWSWLRTLITLWHVDKESFLATLI